MAGPYEDINNKKNIKKECDCCITIRVLEYIKKHQRGSPWSSGDHTGLVTRRSVVQIPLEEEKIFTFQILLLERTFKSLTT